MVADAERAAQKEAGWQAYEAAREAYGSAEVGYGEGSNNGDDGNRARSALDAAVRSLVGI